MAYARRNTLVILALVFVIFEPINGIISGRDLCFAKFDSMLEDACLRGYRMREEAEKHDLKDLVGVTCENSCSDLYKADAKLVDACKYGCGSKLSASIGDGLGSVWDRLRKVMMDQFKQINRFLLEQPEKESDDDDDQDQKASVVKSGGTVVRRIRIFIPLGHPEHATVQRTSQMLDDNKSPLEKLRQLFGLSPLSGMPDNDQKVVSNNQAPHHNQERHSMMHSSNNVKNDVTSFVDKIFLFVGRSNPITIILLPLIFIAFLVFFIQLCICICRRRARRNHLYTALPSEVEKMVPYYHVGADEKKVGEEKTAYLNDAKEALRV